MGSRRSLPLACAAFAGSLLISQALAQAPAPRPVAPLLVCVGLLSQANNMAWDSHRVEFSVDYARNMSVTNLKSSIGLLNGPLLVELDDSFLRARENQPRLLGNDDRAIAVSELKISRNTGAFSMVVLAFRSMDVLEGRSLWEGSCSLQGGAEKKF